MVKKTEAQPEGKKPGSSAGLLDSELANTVKASAQQIWLAGLGAFSKAQEEGGRVFETLVKEGATLQRKTQTVAEARLSEVAGKMSTVAGEVSARAGQQWDKLETIFEERTSKAMSKLGVPTRQDVDALQRQVDELTAALGKLKRATAQRDSRRPASTAGAPKRAPRKPSE